jgi:hypothetical protein
MDIISTVLSLLGMGRDQAKRVNDRRAEVARLNAEAAAEAGRALDILNAARVRLFRRCAEVYPGNPEMLETCKTALDLPLKDTMAFWDMTQDLSAKIASSGWGVDWETALQRAYEMKGTSTRFVPFVSDIVGRLEAAIDADERLLNGPE